MVIYGALITIYSNIDLVKSTITYSLDARSDTQSLGVYSNFPFAEEINDIQSNLKGTWKCALYVQLTFIYRLKLYILFIKGKIQAALYRLWFCYIEVPCKTGLTEIDIWRKVTLNGHTSWGNWFFFYIKSCFILIKYSEQEARFKKYAIMS